MIEQLNRCIELLKEIERELQEIQRLQPIVATPQEQMEARAQYNEEHAAELFPELSLYHYPGAKSIWRNKDGHPVTFTAYGWVVE